MEQTAFLFNLMNMENAGLLSILHFVGSLRHTRLPNASDVVYCAYPPKSPVAFLDGLT